MEFDKGNESVGLETNDARSLNRKKHFGRLLVRFCDFARLHGVNLKPFNDENLLYFSKLGTDQQEIIRNSFLRYYNICLSAVEIQGSLKDNVGHFKLALRRLGFHVKDSVLEELQNNDVIEIYTLDSVQIFRTFNFFCLVNYTLEEIFCRPWFELYRRDHFTNHANLKAVTKVLSEDFDSIYYPNIPVHDVFELQPGSNCATKIKYRFMAPAYSPDGDKIGFVNVFWAIAHTPHGL